MSAAGPVRIPRRSGWIPVLGCGALAGAGLSLYLRDLSLQQSCADTLVCGDFRAEPLLLTAGGAMAGLAAGLALATLAAGRHPAAPEAGAWLAPAMTVGILCGFAVVIAALTLAGGDPAALEVAAIAGWTLFGIGYLALWLLAVLSPALVGAWAMPARGLALAAGALSLVATTVAVSRALGPSPAFL